MPINVNYDPAIALAGQLAHDAGQGKFLQQEGRYNYETGRFDREYDLREEQFAEGQYQYDENQAYNYDVAQQRGGQFQQQLQQQAYQYDEGLQARQQLADQQQAGQLEQQQLRQQGMAEYQTGQLDFQREGIEGREKAAINARQAKMIQGHRDQMFKVGLASARAIEDYPFRRPDQKEQALEQWREKYGEYMEYPLVNTPIEKPAPMYSREQAQEQMESAFTSEIANGEISGDEISGIIAMLGHDEDVEWKWDLDGKERAKFITDYKNQMRLRVENEAKQKASQLEQEEAKIKAVVEQYNDWVSDREKWIDGQLKLQVSKDVKDSKTGYRGGSKQDLADRFRLEYEERYSHTLPSPTTPAEFEALPPGARYRGSDGTVRTK